MSQDDVTGTIQMGTVLRFCMQLFLLYSFTSIEDRWSVFKNVFITQISFLLKSFQPTMKLHSKPNSQLRRNSQSTQLQTVDLPINDPMTSSARSHRRTHTGANEEVIFNLNISPTWSDRNGFVCAIGHNPFETAEQKFADCAWGVRRMYFSGVCVTGRLAK